MHKNDKYYEQIKEKIVDTEVTEKIKNYAANKVKLENYYEIGKLLNEAGSKYGENIIGKYAEKLVEEVGKKYDKKTLYKMKQLYSLFSSEKVAPLERQLCWSHYLVLLPLKDNNKINYYVNQVKNRNLSKRELQTIIKNKEYERLPEETKNKLVVSKEENNIKDLIKNPVVIKNNNCEVVSEKILQRLKLYAILNLEIYDM